MILPTLFEYKVEPSTEQPSCKGQYFRGVVNSYYNGKDMIQTFRLNKLKQKSCQNPECGSCDWLREVMGEEMAEYQNLGGVKPGALYKLQVSGQSDWETGMVDDYDITFVEVKETA